MKQLPFIFLLLVLACAISVQGNAEAFGGASSKSHEHPLTKFEATPPQGDNPGNITYYYCDTCLKYFLDSDGIIEITQQQTLPVEPEIIDYTALEWKVQSNVDITFTTNVDSDYFESVNIDGDKLQREEYVIEDEENLTLTIKARSFAQLSEGNHRLYITTMFGTAKIDFKVVPANELTPTPPVDEYLDFGQIVLIVSVSMLAVICVILSVMYFISKRKND